MKNVVAKHGPQTSFGKEIDSLKYRIGDESFEESIDRIASVSRDYEQSTVKSILLEQKFLPGGRIRASIGSQFDRTPFNTIVLGEIEDSLDGVMRTAAEAARMMRMGAGIGYDFSTLRPRGEYIQGLGSRTGGPVPIMEIFDATCYAISSAEHRRGAQMAVLSIDHPDIEEFIESKSNNHKLLNFNISIAVHDEFMRKVIHNEMHDLHWGGKIYKTLPAREIWEKIMRAAWDWAEPGVIFIDRVNEMNNLWYAETIRATNSCSEQLLPPYGVALLGSFNLVKYLRPSISGLYNFDYTQFEDDIFHVVQWLDSLIDIARSPFPQNALEAQSKRRLGLGVTGLANAIEAIGHPYGSSAFIAEMRRILGLLRDGAYRASTERARLLGPFPLFDAEQYLNSRFVQRLDESIREQIRRHGIRNSHLLSIAPAGTMSITADNVSSGIEPVFALEYARTVHGPEGAWTEIVADYGLRVLGVRGRTADELTPHEHVDVLVAAQEFVDAGISKTCNVGPEVSFEAFEEVYMRAWQGGAKGCTVFRSSGKRPPLLEVSGEVQISSLESLLVSE